LLFQVQPLISKFILPWFGGSPAVWTSCMRSSDDLIRGLRLRISSKYLSPARQGIAHAVLLVAALAAALPSMRRRRASAAR
jgi:hypothetical protein